MQNEWNDEVAQDLGDDPIALREYSTKLLSQKGASFRLLPSVKFDSTNVFGEKESIIRVGERSESLCLHLDRISRLANLPNLEAKQLQLELQRSVRSHDAIDVPVDALLHGCISSTFVNQCQSPASLAIANHKKAPSLVAEVFGERVKALPPATTLLEKAKSIVDLLKDSDTKQINGILVPGMGLLSFATTAKECYQQTVELNDLATNYFESLGSLSSEANPSHTLYLHEIAELRANISKIYGHAMIAVHDSSSHAISFAVSEFASEFSPIAEKADDSRLAEESEIQHIRWPNRGVFSFASDKAAVFDLAAIANNFAKAIPLAQASGGWEGNVPKPNSKPIKNGVLQGQIALVSGSASGIGLATATTLMEAGACVVGADINPEIENIMSEIGALGVTVDLTQEDQIQALIARIIREFGGLDIVVSNAGIFTAGAYIEDMETDNWERSMSVNLTSHQVLLKHAIPFVKKGFDPSIIFIGSRNVNAPGAGAASYSCAKAGLTQLCRVAALELAPEGVRVNVIHPDAVFDTKLWTQDALERSAKRYGLTVEQYKKRNLMKTEITSRSVGNTVVAVASQAFAKSTGAQIPVDGGNDRII